MKKRQKMFGKKMLIYSAFLFVINFSFVLDAAQRNTGTRVELYKSYNTWAKKVTGLSLADRVDPAHYKKACNILAFYNELMDDIFGICVTLRYIGQIQSDGFGIVDNYIILKYLIFDLKENDFLYIKNNILVSIRLFEVISFFINMQPLHLYNWKNQYTVEQISQQKECLNLLLQSLEHKDKEIKVVANNMLHFYLMQLFVKSLNIFLSLEESMNDTLKEIESKDSIYEIVELIKLISGCWLESKDPELFDAQEYFNLKEFPQVVQFVDRIIDLYNGLSHRFSLYKEMYSFFLEKILDKEKDDLPESLYFKTQFSPLTVEALYTNKERLEQSNIVSVKQVSEQKIPVKSIDQIAQEIEKDFPESKPKPKPKAKGKKKKVVLVKEVLKEQESRDVLQNQSKDDAVVDIQQERKSRQKKHENKSLVPKGRVPRIQEGWHTIERALPKVQYADRVYSRYYSTVQAEEADRRVYHDTPLLLDKYLIKYGFKKSHQNATYPGVIDEQYNGYGAIQYPDGKTERVIFVATKGGIDGRVYHRGVLRMKDQESIIPTETVPFPRQADDGDIVDIHQSNSNINELNDLYCVYFENKQTKVKYILFKNALLP